MDVASCETVTAGLPGDGVRLVTQRVDFAALFTEHVRYVGRTLRYLGVGEADLEDACQEVFIVVHKRLDQLKTAQARPWIRHICIHVAQNARRTRRRRREEPEQAADAHLTVDATQHASVESREMRDRLLHILDELDDAQRAVFVLYEIEQLSMAEVASAVECPVQTAYSRLHSARAKVQEAIRSQEAS